MQNKNLKKWRKKIEKKNWKKVGKIENFEKIDKKFEKNIGKKNWNKKIEKILKENFKNSKLMF